MLKLSVEAMPPVSQWIEVEPGVEFMLTTVGLEIPGNTTIKNIKANKILFKFQSSLADGSDQYTV